MYAIVVNIAIIAQTAMLPMVVEGRKWNVVSINPAYPSEKEPANYYEIMGRRGKVYNRNTFILEGDTVIGGRTYKKLLSDGKFVCGLREEEGRVKRSWGDFPEELVFDFNLQPGEIIKDAHGDIVYMQVNQVSLINIDGQSRRCLEMYYYEVEEDGTGSIGGFADYWIEGIGCTGGPYDPFWTIRIGDLPLLLSCYDGEECIFNIEDFNAIFSSVKDVSVADCRNALNPNEPIYNVSGQKVNASYKGVVIQNGMKYLQK